ncbi:C-type lectin lectoxin-Phi2-like isoform X3 [Paralichthys olivaceus]|uniref:C-type lectin lectoxin-Phi2-like isoform X3 n=1 Tax=Paralichthys olivaceus TaxID=8255 RepID=UPI00375344EE
MATSTELEYMNEQPRHEQKCSSNTNQTEKRIPQLLLLSFGVLCIVQAVLNISLRLSLNSSQESAPSVCNTTHNREKKTDMVFDCERKTPSHCNRLQERFNALTKEKNLLQNRITKLNNVIREQSGCVSSQQCPTDWTEINSRCYFVSADTATWEESRQYCKSKGADLMVINSEQELLSFYIMNHPISVYWIGLHLTNGSFRWVDGSALTKESWEPGGLSKSYSQSCVEVNFFKSLKISWRNVPCQWRQRWLCERDPCPLP